MNLPTVGSAREVRDHIIDALRQELIGPSPGYPLVQVNGEEILRQQDPPRYRYSAGILSPTGVIFSSTLDATDEAGDIDASDTMGDERVGGEADAAGTRDQADIESAAVEDRIPDSDIEVDPTSSFLPSTMGLSFLADVSGGIRIDAAWGTYEKEPVPGFSSFRDDGTTPELWFRTPGSGSIDLAPEDLAGRDVILRPARRRVSSPHVSGHLDIDIVSRPWEVNVRLVTVMLVNTPHQPPNQRELLLPIFITGHSARREPDTALSGPSRFSSGRRRTLACAPADLCRRPRLCGGSDSRGRARGERPGRDPAGIRAAAGRADRSGGRGRAVDAHARRSEHVRTDRLVPGARLCLPDLD